MVINSMIGERFENLQNSLIFFIKQLAVCKTSGHSAIFKILSFNFKSRTE